MSHRIAHLNAETRRLRKSAESSAAKLASLKAEAASDAAFKRVLTAPDLSVIQMRPVAGAGTTARGNSASSAAVVIAISAARKTAILQAAGLAPLPKDSVYGVWWIPPRGKPVVAGDFRVGASRAATAALAMPPGRSDSAAIFVQIEGATAPPAGAPVLRSAASGSARR